MPDNWLKSEYLSLLLALKWHQTEYIPSTEYNPQRLNQFMVLRNKYWRRRFKAITDEIKYRKLRKVISCKGYNRLYMKYISRDRFERSLDYEYNPQDEKQDKILLFSLWLYNKELFKWTGRGIPRLFTNDMLNMDYTWENFGEEL